MILCSVDNFKQIEPINKAEEKYFKQGIDLCKLKKQHETFKKALGKHCYQRIDIIRDDENCPEQVFVRDVAFKVDNTWCICNMSTHIREKETSFFIEYLQNHGKSFYQFNSKIEGGDIIVWKQTIFIGISERTSEEAVTELSNLFKDYHIIPIRLNKNILHLDCALGIINNSWAVACPSAINAESYSILSKIFNIIEITEEEQENMATNFLKVEDIVFCEKSNKRVNNLIKKQGFKIVEIEFNEFHKLGGSIRCCSLEYDLDDYICKRYLNCKNNQLYYNDVNLYNLVQKYGNPLKVGYTQTVKNRIEDLKFLFNKSIKLNNYKGKYYYANANKASYYAENVITAGQYADFYETSSVSDLAIVKRVLSKNIVNKKKIICNGIKDNEYFELIVQMVDEGYEILDIIDNVEEFEKLLKHNFKNKIEVGLRVKLKSIYSNNSKIAEYERFGLYDSEIDYIMSKYKLNPNIKLTTIHYHQRSSAFDLNKFKQSLQAAFEVYAKSAKKDYNIVNFDIGGGCPYDKITEYNYYHYVETIINTLLHLSKQYGVQEPNIIQENGRYTVSDSCFNIYKITNVKKDDIPWYIVNDSFMTSLPNTWALGEEFLILPINLLENKKIPVRLAGNTCDCDDVYYYQSQDPLILPEIKNGQTLYIGIFGMGAYQEILSGIGGIHHCLNREENDLIIYKKHYKTNFFYVRKAQRLQFLFKRLLYKNKCVMKKFIN